MEEPFSTRSSKRHALRSAFHLLLDVIYLYKSNRWDISYWAFIWIVMAVSWRTQGKDGFLGRCVMSPSVRLHGHETPEPRLQWFKIKRGDEEGGDLLAACELFLVRVLDFFLMFPHFSALRTVTVFRRRVICLSLSEFALCWRANAKIWSSFTNVMRGFQGGLQHYSIVFVFNYPSIENSSTW